MLHRAAGEQRSSQAPVRIGWTSDAIVELCEESSAAIVITKNADDFGVHNTKCGKDLLRIPTFAFLYLLGNAEKHGYRGIEQ